METEVREGLPRLETGALMGVVEKKALMGAVENEALMGPAAGSGGGASGGEGEAGSGCEAPASGPGPVASRQAPLAPVASGARRDHCGNSHY